MLDTLWRGTRQGAVDGRLRKRGALQRHTGKRNAGRDVHARGRAGRTPVAGVTGVPTVLMDSYRTAATSVVSCNGRGASKTIAMDLGPVDDYDPAYRCIVDPISRWARRA